MDSRIVKVVRDDRSPTSVVANEVLVLPGATNFVTSTSELLDSDSRETLFWVSPNGVRFGIAAESETLRGLGLDPGSAQQAPWPLLRTFATGPELSRHAALLARDTVTSAGAVQPVVPNNQQGLPGGH
nr:ESX-2 secretion system protein eccB2 [Mycolicibacter nonchromogenicus]